MRVLFVVEFSIALVVALASIIYFYTSLSWWILFLAFFVLASIGFYLYTLESFGVLVACFSEFWSHSLQFCGWLVKRILSSLFDAWLNVDQCFDPAEDGNVNAEDNLEALQERARNAETSLRDVEQRLEDCRANRDVNSTEESASDSTVEEQLLSENQSLRDEIQRLRDQSDQNDPESSNEADPTDKAALRRIRQRLIHAMKEIKELKTKVSPDSDRMIIDETTAAGMLAKVRLAVGNCLGEMSEAVPENELSIQKAVEFIYEVLRGIPTLGENLMREETKMRRSQLELGKSRERVLQLESVLRTLNMEARLASFRVNSKQSASHYDAAEYIRDTADLLIGLKKQCQDSYLALEGVGLHPDIGPLQFIQQCTSRIKHLNDKVDQNFKFRNTILENREVMLAYLQDENIKLQTEMERPTPELEQTRNEIRILRLTSMDAAMRHGSRAKLTVEESETRRSRYNFMVLAFTKLIEFVKAIPKQYPKSILPQWIERQVVPETCEKDSLVVGLEDIQELRLRSIELLLYVQDKDWPGSRPNWIPSGEAKEVDDHGRLLQEISKQVSAALVEAEVEMSGAGYEDPKTQPAGSNGTTASRMRDRRKKFAIRESLKSRTSRSYHMKPSPSGFIPPVSRDPRPYGGVSADFGFTNPHEFWSTSFLDFHHHQPKSSYFTTVEDDDDLSDEVDIAIGRKWRVVPAAISYYDRMVALHVCLKTNNISISDWKLPSRGTIDKIRPQAAIFTDKDIILSQIDFMKERIVPLEVIWEENEGVLGKLERPIWELETGDTDLSSREEIKRVSQEWQDNPDAQLRYVHMKWLHARMSDQLTPPPKRDLPSSEDVDKVRPDKTPYSPGDVVLSQITFLIVEITYLEDLWQLNTGILGALPRSAWQDADQVLDPISSISKNKQLIKRCQEQEVKIRGLELLLTIDGIAGWAAADPLDASISPMSRTSELEAKLQSLIALNSDRQALLNSSSGGSKADTPVEEWNKANEDPLQRGIMSRSELVLRRPVLAGYIERVSREIVDKNASAGAEINEHRRVYLVGYLEQIEKLRKMGPSEKKDDDAGSNDSEEL